jgi:hypothetical protein
MMLRALLLLLTSLLTLQVCLAQSNELGSWNILNVRYNIDEKWSVFGEGQLRSLKFYDHFHYYEYKGGINYALLPDVRISLAAGSYQTYREGGDFVLPKNNDEFRIWPQLILLQSAGKLKIEQRYRAEGRFTSNGYRNRFRYRFGVSYPFGKEQEGKKPFQLIFNNELFFTDREPYFERNRSQVALGYRLTRAASIQLGYLHQFDYRINDETGRDFLVVGYYYEFSRREKNNE